MKILKNKKNGYTVELEIEEEYAEVEKAIAPAFKEISKDVKVPGFRPGKVTQAIFEQHFGREVLIEKAANLTMNEAYRKAIEEAGLEPVDYPRDIEMKKFEPGKPLGFSLKIDVVPEVKLKKYKGLKAEKENAAVTDADINEQLERIRENFADYQDADRPIKDEDIVSYGIKAFDGEAPVAMWTKERSGTRVGLKSISEEFDQALIGLKKDEVKTFNLKFKADFMVAEVAGKEIKFEVTITEIKEKVLPELNDELAKKAAGKDSLADLKDEIIKHLTEQKKEKVESDFKDKVIGELIKNNPVELPQAMIDSEVGSMMENLKGQLQQSNLKIEDYAAMLGKTVDSFKEEYTPTAADRVKLRLLLKELVKEEEIKPTEEELDKELEKIAKEAGKELAEIKKNLSPTMNNYVSDYLAQDKALDFLLNNVKIK